MKALFIKCVTTIMPLKGTQMSFGTQFSDQCCRCLCSALPPKDQSIARNRHKWIAHDWPHSAFVSGIVLFTWQECRRECRNTPLFRFCNVKELKYYHVNYLKWISSYWNYVWNKLRRVEYKKYSVCDEI